MNSLVVEFDTFQNDNQPAAAPILDPDNHHISVHTGGSGETSAQEEFSIGRAESGALGGNLNDGQDHTIRVVYDPGTLEVCFDGALVITSPYSFTAGGTHMDTLNPVGGLDLIGGTSAYVGFTGSSGAVLENHDVISWAWDSSMRQATPNFSNGLELRFVN